MKKILTEKDFDSISWHDNHVHGIYFRNPFEGYDNDLIFDIDFITKWVKEENEIKFCVAPALLRFKTVSKLRFSFKLDYKEHLEIKEITRQVQTVAGEYREYFWRIKFHSFGQKRNVIEFISPGFIQELLKPATGPSGQWLDEDERGSEGNNERKRFFKDKKK